MRLTQPLVHHRTQEISGRDLILIIGGLFLLWKSTTRSMSGWKARRGRPRGRAQGRHLASVLVQIALLDIVFSLDSVITAVGHGQPVAVMIAAIVIAVGIMMWRLGPQATSSNIIRPSRCWR